MFQYFPHVYVGDNINIARDTFIATLNNKMTEVLSFVNEHFI